MTRQVARECADIEPLLAVRVAGELESADRIAVADHLAKCDRCFVASAFAVDRNTLHSERSGARDASVPAARHSGFLLGLTTGLAGCVVVAVVALLVSTPAAEPERVAMPPAQPGAVTAGADAGATLTTEVSAPLDAGSRAAALVPAPPPGTDYETMAELRAGDGHVAIAAHWSSDQLIGVTVFVEGAEPHSWSSAQAARIAHGLTVADKRRRVWRGPKTASGQSIRFKLGQHRGAPSVITVAVGESRLRARWPLHRSDH